MANNAREILAEKLDQENLKKLTDLNNPRLEEFVADGLSLAKPASVKVCSDDPADVDYIRSKSVDNREEKPLAIEGHTVHFDGYNDQARDKKATKYLLPEGMELGGLNATGRNEGLAEVRGFLDGAMEGKEAYVRFFCLGPTNSSFSIPCVQITDSAYVAHSEDLLYRQGYNEFLRRGADVDFFRFLHSAGELVETEAGAPVSKNVDKRRVYIDIQEQTVYSSNTQYGGNTIGLKKLALRLAIRKADREGWLAEHMFVMGARGKSGRITYFTGAFPSACGKTSTAMLSGQTIVGDDIAYFRKIDGQVRAANVESGIFGIIRDVNADDDPVIYNVLTNPHEVIFSNVLIKDDKPYWMGMGCELPEDGLNHSGRWHKGKTDAEGKEITPSHRNARYTVALKELKNRDEKADDPEGVPVGGVIYGGRDSDTSVPVQQSFDWTHGIITMGASLESETTAATLGQEGVRKFNIMSNLDFLAIPLGKYIMNNLNFVEGIENPPLVFAVNYFLRGEDGKYLNGMRDKLVWLKWMELRTNGEADVIETPTGLIPQYEDLARLFPEALDKKYGREDYIKQFTVRIPENLSKIDRIERIYREDVSDTPQIVFDTLEAQRKRLEQLRDEKGEYVSPEDL